MSDSERRPSLDKVIFGVAQIVFALLLYLWARSHSPHSNPAKAVNGYVLGEPFYYASAVIAVVIGIVGLIIIVKGLMTARG